MPFDEKHDLIESQHYRQRTSSLSESTTAIDMTRLPHRDPDNPFEFTLQQLESLVDRKDLWFLQQLQGVEGLARGLHTSLTRGLAEQVSPTCNPIDHTRLSSSFYLEKQQQPSDAATTFAQRQQVFGTNTLPTMDSNSLFQLMWIALQDKTLVSKGRITMFRILTAWLKLDSAYNLRYHLTHRWHIRR